MFGRNHHMLWAVAGILGTATVWANAGYLPQAGPVALRFRVPPPPVVEQVGPPAPPPAPIILPPPVPDKPPEPSNPPPVVVTSTNAVEYNAREGEESWPVIKPDAVVVPQMLIRYFTPSANAVTNAAGAVQAPIGFIPPMVATPAPLPSASKPAPPTSP